MSMEGTGMALLVVGWAGWFIAISTTESAEQDLHGKGIKLPADLRTLRGGLNYRKLKALYKREFPKRRKMAVSFYLSALSLVSVLIGVPLLFLSNR